MAAGDCGLQLSLYQSPRAACDGDDTENLMSGYEREGFRWVVFAKQGYNLIVDQHVVLSNKRQYTACLPDFGGS